MLNLVEYEKKFYNLGTWTLGKKRATVRNTSVSVSVLVIWQNNVDNILLLCILYVFFNLIRNLVVDPW